MAKIKELNLTVNLNLVPKRPVKNQYGVFLVMVPIILLGLLMIFGFWFDISQSALRQSALQKIADISAVGAGCSKLKGSSDDETKTTASEIAKLNLVNNGIHFQNSSFINTSLTSQNNQEEIEVKLSGFFDNLIAHHFFNTPKRRSITAEATVAIPGIAVMLLLDISSSMCNEITPLDGEANCPRFLSTKQSMKEFIKSLNPKLDYLSISCFGTSPCGSANMPPVALPFSNDHFDEFNAISAVQSIPLFKSAGDYRAWTNTSGALEFTINQFKLLSPDILSKVKKYIIILTDGNPSHPDTNYNPRIAIDNALISADKLRDMGYSIYAVGYGELATDGNDPYQLDQGSKIRSIILRRITNDPLGVVKKDPEFFPYNNNIPTYATLNSKLLGSGKFYHIADNSKLHLEIFDELAKTLKIRIIK